MLDLDFTDWTKACQMVKNIKHSYLKQSIQMFPFSKWQDSDWKEILSNDFFEKYIKSGLFLELPSTYEKSTYYLQKGEGGFRKAVLVSSINYLVFLTLSCKVEKQFYSLQLIDTNKQLRFCSATFQTLDIEEDICTDYYKSSYDAYRSTIQFGHDKYSYFTKIDIENYYESINIQKLFSKLVDNNLLDVTTGQVFQSLINYFGDGNLPLIDSHGGLSYLATMIYLDELDAKTQSWLTTRVSKGKFFLVRYVDDLVIFYDTSSEEEAMLTSLELLDFLNDIYIKDGLHLNKNKIIQCKPVSKISETIKGAFYDFFVNSENIQFDSYYDENDLLDFLKKYNQLSNTSTYAEFYDVLEVFDKPDMDISRSDILNGFIYNRQELFQQALIKQELNTICNKDLRFLKFSIKQLVTMIMNSNDGILIKSILNNIFMKQEINTYDILIINEYLLHRNFVHKDLLTILRKNNPEISEYIKNYCNGVSINTFKQEIEAFILYDTNNQVYELLNQDFKLHFMKLMFIENYTQKNYLIAHSYLKSYFDRIVAHIANISKYATKKKGKPDFKKFYKETEQLKFLKLFDELIQYEASIKTMSRLRNSNPVNHASAEILTQGKQYMGDYDTNINDINTLIELYKNSIR